MYLTVLGKSLWRIERLSGVVSFGAWRLGNGISAGSKRWEGKGKDFWIENKHGVSRGMAKGSW